MTASRIDEQQCALQSAGWIIRQAMGRNKLSMAIAAYLDGNEAALDKLPTWKKAVDRRVACIKAALGDPAHDRQQ